MVAAASVFKFTSAIAIGILAFGTASFAKPLGSSSDVVAGGVVARDSHQPVDIRDYNADQIDERRRRHRHRKHRHHRHHHHHHHHHHHGHGHGGESSAMTAAPASSEAASPTEAESSAEPAATGSAAEPEASGASSEAYVEYFIPQTTFYVI